MSSDVSHLLDGDPSAPPSLITHTDNITTVYEEGRPAVVRTSTSTNDPEGTPTPSGRKPKPKRRRVRNNYKTLIKRTIIISSHGKTAKKAT